MELNRFGKNRFQTFVFIIFNAWIAILVGIFYLVRFMIKLFRLSLILFFLPLSALAQSNYKEGETLPANAWGTLVHGENAAGKAAPLPIDASGNLSVSATTNAEYDEGDTLGATPTGLLIMGEDASGDAKPVQIDANNKLSVTASATTSLVVTAAPTVSAVTTYTAGDCIGTKQTLTGVTNSSATLVSLSVNDEGAEAQDMDVLIFKADPSNSTFTDNAACAVADADLASLVGVISLRDHYALSDNGLSVSLTDLPINGASSFYAVAVARGAGYTYDATDAVTFVYGVRID